jgi:GntR family transcriptional regulator
MIDPNGEVAPYLQLAAILRAQIESGELAPGSRLPSIIALADTYGVARTTAHKAMRVLVGSGYVVVSRGRGMYISRERGLVRMKQPPGRLLPRPGGCSHPQPESAPYLPATLQAESCALS